MGQNKSPYEKFPIHDGTPINWCRKMMVPVD